MRLFEVEVNGCLNILTAYGKAGAGTGVASGAKQHLKGVAKAPGQRLPPNRSPRSTRTPSQPGGGVNSASRSTTIDVHLLKGDAVHHVGVKVDFPVRLAGTSA
jgi:hypothetical protein